MGDDLGHVKGSVIRQFLGWYVERFGTGGAGGMLQRMRPSDQELIRLQEPGFAVLPSQWYPAGFVHRILDAAVAPLEAESLPRLADEAAVAIIEHSIRGIYKALFRMVATPSRHMKYQQQLWDQHYDSGIVTTEVLSDTCHRTITRDWRAHHRFSCMLNSGAAVPIYQNMGMHQVQHQRLACVSSGDSECVNVVTWAK